MRPRSRLWHVALTLTLVGALASVPASSLADPTPIEKETARSLMADGREKREKGDHKGALADFKSAHAIMNVPSTGFEVGRSQADLGLLIEARDTLLEVTRMQPKAGEPVAFKKAREEALKLADEIAPRIPTMKIVVQGVPEGVQSSVTLDGAAIPSVSISVALRVNPGLHAVVVKAGGAEKKETVTLKEGEARVLEIVFAPGVVPPKGDEPKKDPAPKDPPPKDPPPKDPPVVITPPHPGPETPPSRTPVLAIAGLSLAGVGLIAGSITGLMQFGKTSAIKEQCEGTRCPASTAGELSTAKSLATISTVSFAVAGVGAIIGVIGFATRPRDSASARATVWVGVGSIGVTGAF